jgi:hypothetical protein
MSHDYLDLCIKSVMAMLQHIQCAFNSTNRDSCRYPINEIMGATTQQNPENSAREICRGGESNQSHDGNLTIPHIIINWPIIRRNFLERRSSFTQDIHAISSQGTYWFVERSKTSSPAPTPTRLYIPINSDDVSHSPTVSTLSLLHHYGEVASKGYIEAYFRTFNTLCPILDQASLMRQTELRFMRSASTDGEIETVLLLVVIALGQVAYEGIAGSPIESFTKRSSGVRGGTALASPGATCFDESLRQWALVPSAPSLLRVQVLLLQATFHESSARHWDFWRCTVAASSICEHLIQQHGRDWSATTSEMLKRSYWTCILNEGYYHHDLDLPPTGVFAFQDEIPLPSFVYDIDVGPGVAGFRAADSSRSYLCFLASISLKRLTDRIHDVVHESKSSIGRS